MNAWQFRVNQTLGNSPFFVNLPINVGPHQPMVRAILKTNVLRFVFRSPFWSES